MSSSVEESLLGRTLNSKTLEHYTSYFNFLRQRKENFNNNFGFILFLWFTKVFTFYVYFILMFANPSLMYENTIQAFYVGLSFSAIQLIYVVLFFDRHESREKLIIDKIRTRINKIPALDSDMRNKIYHAKKSIKKVCAAKLMI